VTYINFKVSNVLTRFSHIHNLCLCHLIYAPTARIGAYNRILRGCSK